MFRKLATYSMLLCTTMVMGLLPLSMHLCCEERCCEVTVHKASCCATSDHEKPAIPDDDCCQDQSFFNLAPVFAPIKTCFDQSLNDHPVQEQTVITGLSHPVAQNTAPPVRTIKPPERLRQHLALRVLII